MEILHFKTGELPVRLAQLEKMPDEGVVWIDLLRDEAECWTAIVEPLLQVEIEPQHERDALNPEHPSSFDGTSDYDVLIFEGLGPKDDPFPLETRTAAFFMFDRVLVTVHAEDSIGFHMAKQRLGNGRKCPATVLCLAHLVLDTMVDRYLKVREPLDQQMTKLQDDLLDPKNGMEDWRKLLEGRRVARRLEALSEYQLEALDGWRRGSRCEWTDAEQVRVADLVEHIKRVLSHASNVERDSEAAVQLHFASVTHRTNKIMQRLTVLSAIFFPLTLITGIYGMNFDNMPELHWHFGYHLVLGVIVLVGGVLTLYFRRRHVL